ncbi:glycoside hydrolase family 3 N-terminal domain-containing protein [Erwinia mallotivora]|uniref:glycoside hydrolase family 3 N-terminal domain-containing protein n=1 Tax=Erwinia mallotivora TaxID=69222 RepID=UPI0021BE0C9E|nr:glycoside hydrolase family 3 N-terminal domain-containing protein [Erwinia mallotivora]
MECRYQDPTLPAGERAADLLARMTLDEKIAQMHARWLTIGEDGTVSERSDVSDAFSHRKDASSFEERLLLGVGQITRPFGTQPVDPQQGYHALNQLQARIIASNRFGIPAMFHEECLNGLMCAGATLFPSALNMASSWHPELVKRAAHWIGEEARSIGCHQGLAPVLDVSRDVRWGRTEETYGEDPWLVGVMATRFVQGLQGEKRDLLATLKHYVAHSFSEGARNHAPVHLGFKELNDIFLLPFEMAIKQANAGSVMPAYHDIDNQPCHSDRFLLTELLRERWGFDGLIVADYGGVSLLHQHHGVTEGHAESAAAAFNAGLDIELPKDDCCRFIGEALERGLITRGKIDEIVARILKEKFRLGLFEQPFIRRDQPAFQSDEARAAAYDVAVESIILLENRNLLPLSAPDLKRVAVIGPTADDPLALLSGYSFPVHLILNETTTTASQVTTPLSALRQQLPDCQIQHAPGCYILQQRQAGTPVFPGDVGKAMSTSPVSSDTRLIAQAVDIARESQLAICFVGDLAGLFQSGTVGEGSDTGSLSLPGVQQQLLEAVVATGVPVMVVMTSGRPYSLQGLEEKVAGLMMAWQPGQEGGRAIADLLLGKRAPAGRLVLSVSDHAGAMPCFYNHKMKSSGTPVAFHFPPRYPFGYGLSWSRFAWHSPRLERKHFEMQDIITVTLTVENQGPQAGVEVVQLYVRDKVASLVRPLKELKAFARLELQVGQQADISLQLPTDMLSFTTHQHQRCVEPGDFVIMLGRSAEDILFSETITLVGENWLPGENWRMESHTIISYR